MTHRLKPGDKVRIRSERRITHLVSRLACEGGWMVDPPVDNCRYWNEDDMTLLRRTPKGL